MTTRRMLAMILVGIGAIGIGASQPVMAGGDPENGRALFGHKHCDRCHVPRGQQGAGPPIEELRRPQGEMELAGRLWNHVPAMFSSLAVKGVEWPRLSLPEMADLMAYLQADAARDPSPDLFRGQVILMRKQCLKCHSLRREGGPVKPDLAERREDYESAAAWAVTMWTHTPRMAEMATRQGVPFPRFAGDEMVNLIGLLRSASATPPRGPAAGTR